MNEELEEKYRGRKLDPTQYNPSEDKFRCMHLMRNEEQCPRFESEYGAQVCEFHPIEVKLRLVEPSKTILDDGRDAEAVFEPVSPTQWKVRCRHFYDEKPNQIEDEARQCKNWAAKGLTRCSIHIKNDSALKEMGIRNMNDRIERHRLLKLTDKYMDDGLLDNPLIALQQLAAEVLAFKDFARDKVLELQDTEWDYEDKKGTEEIRAIIQLYERGMDRAARLLADMGKLNLDERLVQISERQGELVATVLETVLRRLDLGDRVDEARNLLGAEFRVLEAG